MARARRIGYNSGVLWHRSIRFVESGRERDVRIG
jgi:hypothetical protein